MIKWLIVTSLIFTCRYVFANCKQELAKYEIYKPKYAQHFSIYSHNQNFYFKTGSNPEKYFTFKREDGFCTDSILIKQSSEKIASLSSTHLTYLNDLNLINRLVGILEKKYIYSLSVQRMIEDKKILEIGMPLNLETLNRLNPDIVLTYEDESLELRSLDILKKKGMSFINIYDYYESNPLGRAEWVVFFGYLFDRPDLAKKNFQKIEDQYKKTIETIKKKKLSKTILVGSIQNGLWYQNTKETFFNAILKDAGAKFVNNLNKKNESIEYILKNANLAQVWFPLNEWRSFKDLSFSDPRYKMIKISDIFHYNKLVSNSNATDMWESGVNHPEIIITDIAKVLYPKEFKQEAKWFQKIK